MLSLPDVLVARQENRTDPKKTIATDCEPAESSGPAGLSNSGQQLESQYWIFLKDAVFVASETSFFKQEIGPLSCVIVSLYADDSGVTREKEK